MEWVDQGVQQTTERVQKEKGGTMRVLKIDRPLLKRQRDELLEGCLSEETRRALFDFLVEIDMLVENGERVMFSA